MASSALSCAISTYRRFSAPQESERLVRVVAYRKDETPKAALLTERRTGGRISQRLLRFLRTVGGSAMTFQTPLSGGPQLDRVRVKTVIAVPSNRPSGTKAGLRTALRIL